MRIYSYKYSLTPASGRCFYICYHATVAASPSLHFFPWYGLLCSAFVGSWREGGWQCSVRGAVPANSYRMRQSVDVVDKLGSLINSLPLSCRFSCLTHPSLLEKLSAKFRKYPISATEK